MTIHDFKERLKYSEAAGDEPFWLEIYTKAFPNLVNIMAAPGDTISQRMGIDRVILLGNGKIIKIDEKKREKNYPDILLEYISVDTTHAPGWIEKDLAIDYLAYAFMPNQRVYLLPWDILRRVWLYKKEIWLRTLPKIEAKNQNYSTWSVAIPTNQLLNLIKTATIIQLDNNVKEQNA